MRNVSVQVPPRRLHLQSRGRTHSDVGSPALVRRILGLPSALVGAGRDGDPGACRGAKRVPGQCPLPGSPIWRRHLLQVRPPPGPFWDYLAFTAKTDFVASISAL